jgi:hypothetical protein
MTATGEPGVLKEAAVFSAMNDSFGAVGSLRRPILILRVRIGHHAAGTTPVSLIDGLIAGKSRLYCFNERRRTAALGSG